MVSIASRPQCFNTLRPRRIKQHFADDIFKRIFFNENVWISIKISLTFVPKGPINNIPALVQIMAWRRPGDKPLSEPMMVSLTTHICITRPQWVKAWWHISRENGRQFRWCLVTCFVPNHYWLNWINQCFKLFWTRSGDYAWYPPQPPGSLVMWDYLTNFEDHFWIACVSYFLDPNMCGFQNICRVLWSQTLVVKWKNKVFILFHQSRSVSSPNPIGCAVTNSCEIHKMAAILLHLNGPRVLNMLKCLASYMHCKRSWPASLPTNCMYFTGLS